MFDTLVPAGWKVRGSPFYVPVWRRPYRLAKLKLWRWKYPNYWKMLLLYGWKQFLPSNPKLGDRAGAEDEMGGTITRITDDYIEISGTYVYPRGDDKPVTWIDSEPWHFVYDRKRLGKLWRRSFGARDQWDFNGKPQYVLTSHR